jgi:NADPH:quinone reductase-like Zn-dependent oxidoreductase
MGLSESFVDRVGATPRSASTSVSSSPSEEHDPDDRERSPQEQVTIRRIRRRKAPKPKITGRRRQRAALIRSPQLHPNLYLSALHSEGLAVLRSNEDTNNFKLLINMINCGSSLLDCSFWKIWDDTDDIPSDEDTLPSLEPIVVAVEATAISGRDLSAMPKAGSCLSLSHPYVCGSSFVGVVHRCEASAEDFGLRPGSRVASIVKWVSNSKFVSLPPDNLLPVPKHLDASDLACLISSYLPAFEALHHGRSRPYRYSRTCLEGRRILITGGATAEAQALLRLAKLAGAEKVYVIAPKNHHSIIEKKRGGALLEDPDDWLQEVQCRMDIIIDYAFPENFSSIQEALSRKGRLVSVPKKEVSVLDRYTLSSMKRATLFDFGEYAEQNRRDLLEDMDFLFQLLDTRKIRPQIDRFVALKDIPAAQKEMRMKPITGIIVCEPWKE